MPQRDISTQVNTGNLYTLSVTDIPLIRNRESSTVVDLSGPDIIAVRDKYSAAERRFIYLKLVLLSLFIGITCVFLIIVYRIDTKITTNLHYVQGLLETFNHNIEQLDLNNNTYVDDKD